MTILLLIARAAPLGAQADTARARHGSIIREIRIQPENIFADSIVGQSTVYKVMNNLHFITKPYVIEQQLLFKVGDPWDSATVDETVRNLRALNLFTRVEIDSLPTDSGVIARVRTVDAWSLGIVFSINTSGSQVGYAIGFNAKNVLGTGTQAQFQYGQNPTRDSIMLGVTRRFFLGTPYDLGLLLSDLSDGTNDTLSFGQPFRTLESPRGWTLTGKIYNGRILQFFDGNPEAQDTLRRQWSLVSINPAWSVRATDESYIRLGLYAQAQWSGYQSYGLPPSGLADTLTAAAGPYLAIGYPDYQHLRFYSAGGRVEDLQLGLTGTLGLYLAPSAWGNLAGGIAPTLTLSAGQGTSEAFLLETLSVSSLLHGGRVDSGSVNAGVTAAWFPAERQMLIAYAGGGMQKNGYPGEEYELGFGYGVRAYPQYAYTGNRMFITSAEYRVIVWPDFYHIVAAGFAAFADYGGAWYDGSPQRTGVDAGVGLRFGARTGTAGYLMRADLCYRWGNDVVPPGWVFTFGKGFVWQQF